MNVMMIMRSQSGVPGGVGTPGGQIGMIQIAKTIAQTGIDIELFVGGSRMEYLSGLEGVTTTYFRWPIWLDRLIKVSPNSVRILGKNFRRRNWLQAIASLPGFSSADVIHIQGLEDAEALLNKYYGPFVVTHWGRVGRWLPNGSKIHDQSLIHRISRIRNNVHLVAIGEAQREDLTSAGMPPAVVIPPGIDLQHFKPGDRAEARRRLALTSYDHIVLYVGRLSMDKNVETLMLAFKQLPQRFKQTRLLIIGDGPLRIELHRLSIDLGINDSTTFLPFVPHQDLPLYYQAADVTVVPSNLLETFCMVALEAIACRCPLIVTEQVPEILKRFPTVPSMAPYDNETLHSLIVVALEGRMQPADDTQVASYDWRCIAHQYINFYKTAIRRDVAKRKDNA
jgi:glycosyltransferase involved in cell wall biosynthesis